MGRRATNAQILESLHPAFGWLLGAHLAERPAVGGLAFRAVGAVEAGQKRGHLLAT